MLTVAIASENDAYDAEIYRALLELVLERPVTRYPTQRAFMSPSLGRDREVTSFGGWKSVRDLADPYLKEAHRQGVQHALFAIDNDGGTKRAAEHDDAHQAATEASGEDGCRVCWLAEALPAWWSAAGGKRCLVVPVQTIETWLLCIKGTPPFASSTPEQTYHRRILKERFLGKPRPPQAACVERALVELRKPHAIATLRERRSFRHFETQLLSWL